jgi:choline dehydrogenase-like flavoprotein
MTNSMTRPLNRSLLDFYADPDAGSWEEVGYVPYPLDPPAADTPVVPRPKTQALSELRERYDAIVVGSGAGGGVAAFVLAAAGASVLVIERGQWYGAGDLEPDHIRNHRFFFGGDLDTPPGHPRAVLGDDDEIAVDSEDGRYHHNAITVGGGTRFFGAQAWRFRPEDFRMASLYGVPEGSALADWPITYDDLEPFTTRWNGNSAWPADRTPTTGAVNVTTRCRRSRRPRRPPCSRPVPTSLGGRRDQLRCS